MTNYYGDNGGDQTITNEGIKFLNKDVAIPARCKYIIIAHVTMESSNPESNVLYMWEGEYVQDQSIIWDIEKNQQHTFQTVVISENNTDSQKTISLSIRDTENSAKIKELDNSSLNRIMVITFPTA